MAVYSELANSTYLDLTSYRGNEALPDSNLLLSSFTVNVALVLDRANDPTALLSGTWATRQAALADQTAIFQKYGADPTSYNNVLTALGPGPGGLNIPTVDQVGANGYVSSVESRTIWVQLNDANFTSLFGSNAALFAAPQPDAFGNPIVFWKGNLSLPDTLINAGVSGIWFDWDMLSTPILADHPNVNGVALNQGPQSVGNSGPLFGEYPNAIAAAYNFPLSSAALWTSVPTGPVGLIEPGIGTEPNPGQAFQELLNAYRKAAGIAAPAPMTIDVAPGGQQFVNSPERSLDVGIVTTVNPQSPLVIYAGSGVSQHAHFDVFTAYQAAFWDTVNNPEVISSSTKSFSRVAPGSPFYSAIQELFVDAALRNITVVNSAGDGGSADQYPNGLTNISVTHASPYSVMAGGASFSTVQSAGFDATLNGANPAFPNIFAAAMVGDPATIWLLVASGLKVLPSAADATEKLVEATWNTYSVSVDIHNAAFDFLQPGYLNDYTGSGGVDPSQPQPSYQTAFGLDLHTSDPQALAGRGAPDVSAVSGGNLHYIVPGPDMTGTILQGGTSAAAPLWGALFSQVNAIFRDQGLRQLGYANDLLYIAAAIAPAAFNDITLGNNISSMVSGGTYLTPEPQGSPNPDQSLITPTGYGYFAGPGYDLTTGLGSPNGTLLARAMTSIAHSQVSFGSSPDMLDSDGSGGWTSGVDQSLMFQAMLPSGATVGVDLGSGDFSFASAASGTYAWTNRLAQQVMQSDFDPNLVRLFDKQAQGWVGQSVVEAGEQLAVSINASSTVALQGTMTSPFGFADLTSANGAVRVARPVAVAETAGGADNTIAIVRMRQNGEDNLSVTFYRVDDYNGAVNGVHVGDSAYAGAAQSRAYQLSTGNTVLNGPGYGNFGQAGLLNVDGGDLIAMQLVNNTTGAQYWAFASANEKVGGQSVGHLWNYGLNTWGWEDTFGGGDRDFNDLVVQIDFTSASGHGWLA